MNRNRNVDIIRVFATFCVNGVHFFLNTEFYNQNMIGPRSFIGICIRSMFMVCVPLFLLLTGFLMNKKTLSKSYYRGILRTLAVYLIVSAIQFLCYKFYFKDAMSVQQGLSWMLSFGKQGESYAWYLEMYIGLFLLIPFLNLAYGAGDKNTKRVLIFTLVFLSMIPDVVSVLPSWWVDLYPITYYFIGCYIREMYEDGLEKISIRGLILAWVVMVPCVGAFNYYKSSPGVLLWGDWQTWGSIFNAGMAIVVFLFFLKIPTEHMPTPVESAFRYLARWSLGAFLISRVVDRVCYSYLNNKVPEVLDRMYYLPIIVPVVFVCSMLASACIDVCMTICGRLGRRLLCPKEEN